MYTYIFIYVHICKHIFIYMFIYIYMYICLCVCMYTMDLFGDGRLANRFVHPEWLLPEKRNLNWTWYEIPKMDCAKRIIPFYGFFGGTAVVGNLQIDYPTHRSQRNRDMNRKDSLSHPLRSVRLWRWWWSRTFFLSLGPQFHKAHREQLRCSSKRKASSNK